MDDDKVYEGEVVRRLRRIEEKLDRSNGSALVTRSDMRAETEKADLIHTALSDATSSVATDVSEIKESLKWAVRLGLTNGVGIVAAIIVYLATRH